MDVTTASRHLPLGRLRVAVAALAHADNRDLATVPRGELLELVDGAADVLRSAEAVMAVVGAEVARRSTAEDGHSGLAAREGCRSVREFLAKRTGSSMAQAQRLVDVGELITGQSGPVGAESMARASSASDSTPDSTPDTTPDPTPDPSLDLTSGHAQLAISPAQEFHSALAHMVRSGDLGIDAAALFRDAYGQVEPNDRATRIFMKALGKAPGLVLHQVRALVWQAQAMADPQAWRVREERHHEARMVHVRDETDGMVTITARLAPIAAAPIKAVLDGAVRWAMQERRDSPDQDQRTPAQMRADALVDMARHMQGCTDAAPGVKTTVVVRMNVDDLRNDVAAGVGEIDGINQPVSAQALRQQAGDAEVIPAVLTGESEVLDWGRAKRLFTSAQRLALVERDGGCAWCHAPPSWCEAHHIRWWERDAGPTDLANGVLLCSRCHHRVHRDGWDIEVTGSQVRFTLPVGVHGPGEPRPKNDVSDVSSVSGSGSGGHETHVGQEHGGRPTNRRTTHLGGRARFDGAA